MAILESGTQFSLTPIYNFSPKQQSATDIHGAFKLCAQAVTSPSAIVLEAMDATGKAYPPFVAPISGATDLGTIPMGGCTAACGLIDNQQQTSLPATITGTITSSPITKTGSIVPQYSMLALDGAKASNGSAILWGLAMPMFIPAQTSAFSTAASACPGGSPFCATYSISVPSQKTVQPFNGGYLQEAGVPDYLIYAVPDGPASCSPASASIIQQQNGTLLLPGAPGTQVAAKEIDFTLCQ